jgi:3-hydroxyisobutyrate dehydrogenase
MARVAFIGLGHMGGGMAPNLAKAGHEVRAFDLSEEALAHAVERGCKRAKSAAEAVNDADAVVTMLPAGKHVAEVYRSHVFGKAPKSAILIDCSTIDVATAKAVEEEAQAQGYTMVDAPVSGGIAAAEGGTLTFMVGGSKKGFQQAREYLEKMGKAVIHAGDAGAGQAAKICNNMLLGATMAATCEAFVLAEKLGLDPKVGPETPADREYEGGFAAALMLKDLKLAMEAAQKAGAYTPMGGEAADLFQRFVDLGGGTKDFSALIKMIDDSWHSPEGEKHVAPPVTALD